MNILVGDSGASKTDWVLLGDEDPQFIQTEGLNPHLLTAEEFLTVLTKELKPNLSGRKIDKIYFYGAGCGPAEKKKEVESYHREVFGFADLEIHTDLDAAGLALFGKREGLVCVLGTGSSAGFYKNGEIVQQMPSKGYPNGDEGSGSDIGKKLMISYLQNKMKPRLKEYFEEQVDLNLEMLFYRLQNPRESKLFVSDVCRILGEKSVHPQIQEIIFNGFSEFLTKVTEHFPEEAQSHEIGFVGSIASVYEGELRACAKQKNLEVSSVIRSPIEHIALHFSR